MEGFAVVYIAILFFALMSYLSKKVDLLDKHPV